MAVNAARAKSLFLAASDLSDRAERAAYLNRECGGDVELRARVEALLRADEVPPDFVTATGAFAPGESVTVDLPASGSAPGTFGSEAGHPGPKETAECDPVGAHADRSDTPTRWERAPGVPLGTVIASRYTLAEVIGEGGMGSVYRATQTAPVKRQVALKLIKAGMDSKAVLARFDAERQALALMDHPNIARIYDGGIVSSVADLSGRFVGAGGSFVPGGAGQPFFVMELVQGLPLTGYCDARRLSVDARLRLFLQVCQAVQHAHQKGIIHRDLKPGNVLVTEVDGRPTPKVIDFGVAKATDVKLTDMSVADTGAIVGTPAYMSPEQADPTSMDIDTRTDVYALGVMLYELLTGSPPIDVKRFKRVAIHEILRMVREAEPPKPSTKLSTAEALPEIAANRSIEPAKLSKLLRGELDWVVMKAIEKDRTRRYDTANGLARDIQRHLADEVVEARPPSTGYRLRKFVKRHRGQVLAAGLVLVALVSGVVGTSVGLVRANAAARNERDANAAAQTARIAAENAAKAEELAKVEAQNAAAKEKAANEQTQRGLKQITNGIEQFAGLLTGINPRNEELGGPTVYQQLRERAEKAADALDADAVGDPLAVARLQAIYGNTLRDLGNAAKAVELLEKACATQGRELGSDHPDTLNALKNLAEAYEAAGKSNRAIELYEKVRDAFVRKLGPEHPDTLNALNGLAVSYRAAGKTRQAIELLEQVRDAQVKALGAEHRFTLLTLDNLATAYQVAGRTNEAIEVYEKVREACVKKIGPEHPDALCTLNNLATAYNTVGKTRQAIELLQQVRDVIVKKLGPEHPDTLGVLHNLAVVYRAAGKTREAIELLEQVRDAKVKKLGPEHPSTLISLNSLARAYQAAGRTTQLVEVCEQVRDAKVKKLGADHPDTLIALDSLAVAYQAAGRTNEAIELFERVREACVVRKPGFEYPDTLNTLNNLAMAYRDAGKTRQSIDLLEQVRDAKVKKLGPDHPDTLVTLGNLGAGYCRAGQGEKGAATLKQYVDGKRKRFPADDTGFAVLLAKVAQELLNCGQYATAEETLRECLNTRVKTQPDVWLTFSTRSMLGGALLGQKKYTEAEPLLLSGYEGLKQRQKTIPSQGAVRILEALDLLIELYTATDQPDEVTKWRAERAKYPELAPPPREQKH